MNKRRIGFRLLFLFVLAWAVGSLLTGAALGQEDAATEEAAAGGSGGSRHGHR